MKKTNIAYWIFTILTAILFGMGIVSSIRLSPDSVALIVTHLGYPSYILPFLGVAKLLGVIAILVPGFPKIKEWAYAGLTFDLAGATYSSIAVGDPVKNWTFFLLFFIMIAGSYYFYHKRLSQA
ncbi:MAG: DoxX family protein [Bacteroidota bacterium]|nr:DoxX family protein [Bacteroidota bacterium]MDP4212722.1 DoxX family protein [Bacteroidota bacterium]MDP4250534.1 DoxX family protein [Bacteroidota bacterium]